MSNIRSTKESLLLGFRCGHYSEIEGFRTLRIPSAIVETNAKKITKAVIGIISNIDLMD